MASRQTLPPKPSGWFLYLFLGVAALIVVAVILGLTIGGTEPYEDIQSEYWWYNHQLQIPPEAACPPEIDFVLQLPANWDLARLDCETVWFSRRDKDALVTVSLSQPKQGTPSEHVLVVKGRYEDPSLNAMFDGGVDFLRAKWVYTTGEGADTELHVVAETKMFGRMGNCESVSHWRFMALPTAERDARYNFGMIGTVCNDTNGATAERIRIFESLRFPTG